MSTVNVICDSCGEDARHRDPTSRDHLCEPCAAWRHGSQAGERYAAALSVARVLADAERELGAGTLRDLLELVIEHGAEAVSDVPAVGVLHADATRRPWRCGMDGL